MPATGDWSMTARGLARMPDSPKTSAAATIAGVLSEAGLSVIFGVPGGGGNLDLVGAAERAGMRFALGHAEAATAIMAATWGELTGEPGVCVVTRGPGVASAVNGAAHALLDRAPMLLISDSIPYRDRARIGHQRIDQRAMLAPVTKWTVEANRGNAAEATRRAIEVALRHPRGPVHIDVVEDGTEPVDVPPAPGAPSPADIEGVRRRVAAAQRPVVLVGLGARGTADAVRDALDGVVVPILSTYKAKGVIPEHWPSFAGLVTGSTIEAPLLEAADLIVTVGFDPVELLPGPWDYPASVIALDAWEETDSYFASELRLTGDLRELADALRPLQDAPSPPVAPKVALDALLAAIDPPSSGLSPQAVALAARAHAPQGTTATVDAGAHMLVSLPAWTADRPNEVLISNGLSTMAYALPAAIAAALARPGERVCCLTGDGGLAMAPAELETAVRLRLPITVVVFNDSVLSLIEIKRGHGHPGPEALRFSDVDFATIAAGLGMPAQRVANLSELDAAMATAYAADGPFLIDAVIDRGSYPDIAKALRGPR